MEGIGQGYAVGVHFNPSRAGEALVATADSPPGLNGRVYHSSNGGHRWTQVRHAALPKSYNRVPVLLYADGAAWIATEEGDVFRADAPRGKWSLVCQLPAAINAAVAGGSPSSVLGWR